MGENDRQPQTSIYEIRVSGRLSQELAGWLGDLALTVSKEPSGSVVTTLRGPLCDQAALFGILARIRDLGLKLVSVNRVDEQPGFQDQAGFVE